MPEIIGAAASQLANANVTVLNGADGMGDLLAGFATQASQLMRIVQDGLGPTLGQIAPPSAAPGNGSAQLDEPQNP
jgi:flotillin